MSEQRHELKVGVFVVIGLVLIGALMLYFSKAQSFFTPTYTLFVRITNVGGLKKDAKVMLSGIEIGSVEGIALSSDEKTAIVKLKLLRQYKIHKDARFKIAALGLLGDQNVAVVPTKNAAPLLEEGETVQGEGPVELEEIILTIKDLAPSAHDAIDQLKILGVQLNTSVKRLDNVVLNEQTLGHLTNAVRNFQSVSEKAITAVEDVDAMFKTNTPALNTTMTNLSKFSEQLNGLADELNQTIITNRTTLTHAMENLEKASVTVNELVNDVHSGKGIAGSLIEDRELKLEMSAIITNLSSTISNLNILSSNINSKGLWAVIRKPKPAKQAEPKRESRAEQFAFPGNR
jgi:phospholipid/cholesterol/gamma-HCH transport system substrate-binding protein